MTTGEKRVFKVVMSDRCFRFKPDALPSHAPAKPGVYEFVTFDPKGDPTVLYVGHTVHGTVQRCLADHMAGRSEPTSAQLFAAAKDVYFDYVAQADIHAIEELQDIAAALIARHQPKFNTGPAPSSGKHSSVEVEEIG